jgi:hypothetical protein
MINVERSARVTLNNLAAYEFVFVFSRDGIAKKLRGKPQRNETNKKAKANPLAEIKTSLMRVQPVLTSLSLIADLSFARRLQLLCFKFKVK